MYNIVQEEVDSVNGLDGNGNFWSVNFHGFRKTFPLLSEAIRCAINEGKTKEEARIISQTVQKKK